MMMVTMMTVILLLTMMTVGIIIFIFVFIIMVPGTVDSRRKQIYTCLYSS